MNALLELKQRADYTHKYNATSGRHGWLRLTPAYSVKVVEEILSNYEAGGRVLDPFCGSGTTALCAARRGLPVATTDINPFLIWLATVKTKIYSVGDIASTRKASEEALQKMGKAFAAVEAPPIHKIERWWSDQSLTFLCQLKGAIDGLEVTQKSRDLLLVAFCRTLIKISNAAFNHQSMSFKEGNAELDLAIDRAAIFKADVAHILEGCGEEIHSVAKVKLQDARLLKADSLGKFDLVITSPPYANRMSYIRELRPYMYWLGYLHEAREAGELDWQAIGGTWGIATSRLNDWAASEKYQNDHLSSVVAAISQAENKHAETLSRYVHKYHEDIFAHLSSLTDLLNKGARVHYIIGNSTFYGTLVKVEDLYADMMKKVGFSNINIKAIRKRNSKKELVEFDVSATW
jgi:16S rRNA G966 N2-methylase RsmD